MLLRRIHPEPGEVEAAEALAGLALGDRAPADRPYVVCNMVASVDGRATIGGRSGPIGDDADRALFLALRTQADALLVGTRTLRAERYGRPVRSPELRAAREREGLSPAPPLVTVTRTLDLPLDIPLFQDPESTVLVYTSAEGDPGPCPADVRVARLAPGELTPATVLRSLRADHDVRSVLCEGGPTLNAALLRDDALDELFLSLSPLLAGDPAALGLVEGAIPATVGLELVCALERDGALFLRYRVQR